MSFENSPARKIALGHAITGHSEDIGGYWHGLIDESAAAEFLNLSVRSLQGFRYRGGGPQYVKISSRCLRYRRLDLQVWAEARIRTSTSDSGEAG